MSDIEPRWTLSGDTLVRDDDGTRLDLDVAVVALVAEVKRLLSRADVAEGEADRLRDANESLRRGLEEAKRELDRRPSTARQPVEALKQIAARDGDPGSVPDYPGHPMLTDEEMCVLAERALRAAGETP